MKFYSYKKKSISRYAIGILFITLLFNSCSIDKRVYNRGYHIDNIFSGKHTSYAHHEQKPNIQKRIILNVTPKLPTALPSNQMNQLPIHYTGNASLNPNQLIQPSIPLAQPVSNPDSCDVIIFKNGDQINAIVLEITDKEVKFRECDKPNGPIFSKQKSTIVRINYPNGTSTIIGGDRYVSFGKKDGNEAHNQNDRSFIITVLLWLLAGTLGAHRFYLGHYGIGILYLLTGALCGIGWLIDGILLLTGELQPKNGKYTDN